MGLGKAYIAGRRQATAGFMACLGAKIAAPPARPCVHAADFCRGAAAAGTAPHPLIWSLVAHQAEVSIKGGKRTTKSKRTTTRKGAGLKRRPSAMGQQLLPGQGTDLPKRCGGGGAPRTRGGIGLHKAFGAPASARG